jgi:hypothetical protein
VAENRGALISRASQKQRERAIRTVGVLPMVPRRYQTTMPEILTHLAGHEPRTRKIGFPRVGSYITVGGQLIRSAALTGRSAVVPMTISLVAWSGWIVSASGNGISTVAPVIG